MPRLISLHFVMMVVMMMGEVVILLKMMMVIFLLMFCDGQVNGLSTDGNFSELVLTRGKAPSIKADKGL